MDNKQGLNDRQLALVLAVEAAVTNTATTPQHIIYDADKFYRWLTTQ